MIVNGYEIKPGANLKVADLRRANLEGANLEGANLWSANLEDANLKDANVTNTILDKEKINEDKDLRIQELEAELVEFKSQLSSYEEITIENASVGDVLEDGSIDLTQKIKDLTFKDIPMGDPDSSQKAHHAPWGSITVLDRMTGFGWRDVETGFRDPDGLFWLASGDFDITDFPDLSISEAIELIKENANTCIPKI